MVGTWAVRVLVVYVYKLGAAEGIVLPILPTLPPPPLCYGFRLEFGGFGAFGIHMGVSENRGP